MEEKERYEVISPSLNGYAYIHDFKTDNVLNTYDSCDLLNQQSKRIKELEQENQQLKQQLNEIEKENKALKDIRTLERVIPKNTQLNKLSNRDCYLKGFDNAVSETIRVFEETYGKDKTELIEERNEYLSDIVKVGGYKHQIEELKQQLAENEVKIANLEVLLLENANDRKAMQEFKIGEDEYDLTDEDARNSLCWEVEKLKQQLLTFAHRISDQNEGILKLHDLPKKIVCEISEAIERLSWRKRIYTNWEFDKEQLYKDLDTILKKYGGENE